MNIRFFGSILLLAELASPCALEANCKSMVTVYIDISGSMFKQEGQPERPIDGVLRRLKNALGKQRDPELTGEEDLEILAFGATVGNVPILAQHTNTADPRSLEALEKELDTLESKLLTTGIGRDKTNFGEIFNHLAKTQSNNKGSRNIYMVFSDFVDDAVHPVGQKNFDLEQWQKEWLKDSEIPLNEMKTAFSDSEGNRSGLVLLFKATPIYQNSALIQSAVTGIMQRSLGNNVEELNLGTSDIEKHLGQSLAAALGPISLDIKWRGPGKGFKIAAHNRTCNPYFLKHLELKYGYSQGTSDIVLVKKALSSFSSLESILIDESSDLPEMNKGQPEMAKVYAVGWRANTISASHSETEISRAYQVAFVNMVKIRSAWASIDRSKNKIDLLLDVTGQIQGPANVKIFPFESGDLQPIGLGVMAANSTPDVLTLETYEVLRASTVLDMKKQKDPRRWSLCGDDTRPIRIRLSVESGRTGPNQTKDDDLALWRLSQDGSLGSTQFWERIALPGCLLIALVLIVAFVSRKTTLGLLEETAAMAAIGIALVAALIHDATLYSDPLEGFLEQNDKFVSMSFATLFALMGVLATWEGVLAERISPAFRTAAFARGRLAKRRIWQTVRRWVVLVLFVVLGIVLNLALAFRGKPCGQCAYYGEVGMSSPFLQAASGSR